MNLATAPPKSQQIAELLRKEIINGHLKPGERIESVRDLAERFKVSRQVIRSAFDILAKDNMLVREVGCGTFVNPDYKKPGTSLRLAFYLNFANLDNSTYQELYNGCGERAQELGCDLIHLWHTKQPGFVKLLAPYDALLVTGAVDDALIRKLKKTQKPFLVVGNYDLKEKCTQFRFDVTKSCQRLLEQALIKFPVNSIGAIIGPASQPATVELTEAFRMVTSSHGMKLRDSDMIYCDTKYGYTEISATWGKGRNWPELVVVTEHSYLGLARFLFENNISHIEMPRIILQTTRQNMSHPPYPELIAAIFTGSGQLKGRCALDFLLELYHSQAHNSHSVKIYQSPETQPLIYPPFSEE